MKKTTTARKRYLTPKEFLELPLSEAIPIVLNDAENFTQHGVMLEMSSWFTVYKGRICSVCLGGAALCSFAPEEVNGYNIGEFSNMVLGLDLFETNRIADTFNFLRQGYYHDALLRWGLSGRSSNYELSLAIQSLVIAGLNYYSGRIDKSTFGRMKVDLLALADLLAEHGY